MLQLPPRRSQSYYSTVRHLHVPHIACHNHLLGCPQDNSLIRNSNWISIFFCFVIHTFDLAIAVFHCAALHSPIHDSQPLLATTLPQRASMMWTTGLAARSHCSRCATKPLKHAPPQKPTPRCAGSTAPRRCCFMPRHHPSKIHQPLVTTVRDPSTVSFFFFFFSMQAFCHRSGRPVAARHQAAAPAVKFFGFILT